MFFLVSNISIPNNTNGFFANQVTSKVFNVSKKKTLPLSSCIFFYGVVLNHLNFVQALSSNCNHLYSLLWNFPASPLIQEIFFGITRAPPDGVNLIGGLKYKIDNYFI